MGCGLLALTAYLVIGGYVSVDPMYSLAWGRQIAHGHAPDFSQGPTPHPLSNAVATTLAFAGARPEIGLLVISYSALAVLAYSCWLIASRLAGPVAGVAAVILLVSRQLVLSTTALAFLDLPYAALVMAAAAIEVRRSRSGAPVMCLLGLAGLLRPEAWIMSGLYWLWMARSIDRRAAARLAFIALIAPVLWVASDLVITGDPLFSITDTRTAARSVTLYGHGPIGLVKDGPRTVSLAVGRGVALSALLGLVLLFRFERRDAFKVAAIAATVAVATAAPMLVGTVINPRYFLSVAALLCVLAGVAVGGWVGRSDDRRLWSAAAVLSVLLLVSTAPSQLDGLRNLRKTVRTTQSRFAAVRALLTPPLPCRPLVAPNARLRPFAAVWRRTDLSSTVDASARTVSHGSYITGVPSVLVGVVVLPDRDRGALIPPPPASAQPVRSGSGWTLYSMCRAAPRGDQAVG